MKLPDSKSSQLVHLKMIPDRAFSLHSFPLAFFLEALVLAMDGASSPGSLHTLSLWLSW